MKNDQLLIRDVGLDEVGGKSRGPALMDLAQALSGLLLVLFMLAHMLFVSSIHVSKDAMYTVTRFFEGEFLFGRPQPWLVSVVVVAVIVLFVGHAWLDVIEPHTDRKGRITYAVMTERQMCIRCGRKRDRRG